MIRCDVFDLGVELLQGQHPRLRWGFHTDLPCGTRVILQVSRLYPTYEGHQEVWIMFSDAVEVAPLAGTDLNGQHGEISVDDADARGLRRFEELLDQYSKGIKEPVGDQIDVSCIVGGRQPLRAFGRANANLHGGRVKASGGINIVSAETTITCPMKPRYQPVAFKTLHHHP